MFLPKKTKKPKQNQFQTPFKLCTLAKQMDLTAASTVARLVTAVFYMCADLSFYFRLDVGPCNILCVNVLRPAWTLNTLSFLCFWWFFFWSVCLFVFILFSSWRSKIKYYDQMELVIESCLHVFLDSEPSQDLNWAWHVFYLMAYHWY